MKKILKKIGKFYSNIFIRNIGIFIFVGILAVVFGDNGWFPNEDIYAVSQLAYHVAAPILIAFTAGEQIWNERGKESQENIQERYMGGILGVMSVLGVLVMDASCGILAAIILGPLSGLMWRKVISVQIKKVPIGMEMLVRNLTMGIVGGLFSIAGYYLFAPAIQIIIKGLLSGVNVLMEHNLFFLLSFIIEPSKIFFLNNSINHGILLPMGMQQVEQTGESILFLLESNPGPGLGILMALYVKNAAKRREYVTAAFVEAVGGVHEVYFPMVLSNMRLVLALIAGGVAGDFTFSLLHAATTAPVSPGSIFTLLAVASKNRVLAVLLGVVISMLVSMMTGLLILSLQQGHEEKMEIKESKQSVSRESVSGESLKKGPVKKVGFICDAGVGSSAMGAALFRRKLKELHIEGVEVTAYPRDQIPENLDIIVCQKEIARQMNQELIEGTMFSITSLVGHEEYDRIVDEIARRNGECI